MITGIGIDLIEIDRVAKACESIHFQERVYTENERKLIAKDIKKAASNFAVKEAVAKALGCGFRGFGPSDIEALRDELGAPCVELHGGAKEKAEEIGIHQWHISISHTDTQVTAIAIAEKEPTEFNFFK